MSYQTPKFKIKINDTVIIAQAYNARTAAFIALHYKASVSYLYKFNAWKGTEERFYPDQINEATITQVAEIIQQRVDEYKIQRKIRANKKMEANA